jgi:hypothetical protein
VAALGVLRAFASVAGGNTSSTAVSKSVALLILVVVLMTGALTRSRQIQAMDSRLFAAGFELPQGNEPC